MSQLTYSNTGVMSKVNYCSYEISKLKQDFRDMRGLLAWAQDKWVAAVSAVL